LPSLRRKKKFREFRVNGSGVMTKGWRIVPG